MIHVEAVIRIFDPAYNVTRIAARRRYKGNGLFKRGTILRNALDVLRKAQGPLTAREVTERMLVRARSAGGRRQGHAKPHSERANVATKS